MSAQSEIATLPGDPDGIKVEASKYTATATAVRNAANEIRRLATDSASGESEAVSALVEISDDVADRLDKLHGRYETAGSALTTYATTLATAQTMAAAAVRVRDNAVEDSANATRMAQHYEDEATAATTPDEKAEAERMQRHYTESDESAGTDLAGALASYREAVEMRDTAAAVAADLISAAIDKDGLNDSLWDDFSGWVADHAELLKAIKDVLGWIATALAFASLIFPVLAPFALAFAGATALVSLVLSATGQQSWIEFGLDFLSFATMGVGMIAGKALKGTMTVLKSTRVGRLAAAGHPNPLRAVTGSFNGVLPSKVGLLNKLSWAKEVFSAKGVFNASAMRVLTRSQTGATGAADAALVLLGKSQYSTQIIAATLSGTAGKIDTALGSAGKVGDLLTKYVPAVPTAVTNGLDGVGDWYEGVGEKATWRIGSSW
ncbi:hypothetical protein [Glaciihabitans sp. dw_435]|uniref:hypothetical protein n=1 Tax=Glaciihabitans sp. dw_435 TaxID=2720081 RepID=UPI001BD3F995|nr:hypothetical protein [Glaciihabitans sp. dw_435]